MRQQKKSEHLNCKLDKDVADKLAKICEETGLSKTATVERALRLYYDTYRKTGKV